MRPEEGEAIVLGARLVFPVEGEPIADGRLTIRGGRIVAVDGPGGPSPDLDLGHVAITPGFVNAHTHLELSTIERAGEGPEDEIEWLKRVIAQRWALSPADLDDACRRNLDHAIACGTTMLADTTTAGRSWPHLSAAPIRSVVFAEILGLRRMRGLETSQEAWDWIASVDQPGLDRDRMRPGLSPHAPYSTAGWLYHRAVESGYPLSTHLAEMPEEEELLRDRSGGLRSFLEGLGAWDEEWEPIGGRPIDYVRRDELRDADWIVAHANYVEPSEFWALRPEAAPPGRRIAVAYCPRTHDRFGHAPHPFRGMLEAGVVVCLGTDSLASSPSLGVLDEIRFLHRKHPELGGALLMTMGTLFGAWALRGEARTGSLRPGKSADLAVIALPDDLPDDPYLAVLDSDLPVAATCCEGRFVAGPEAWRSIDGS